MIFVDTNVIAYAAEETDTGPADLCRMLMSAVRSGQGLGPHVLVRGRGGLAPPVRGRPRLKPLTAQKALTLFAPVLPMTHEIVRQAMALEANGLGSNDRIHVATCRAAGIDTIVTADAGFDGVEGLRRVDLGDRAAMEALLSA